MDWMQFLLGGLCVLAGCTLQSAVGFGGSLLALPLLLWVGLSLPEAVALNGAAGLVQMTLSLWVVRAHVPWRETWPLSLGRILMLPVGVWLMGLLVASGEGLVKQVIGAILLAVMVILVLLKVQPRERLHPAWAPGAGVLSGLLAGGVGMGGPPMVLWVMAHDWPPPRSKGFIWACAIQLLPFLWVILTWRFGPHILITAGFGLLLAPASLLGAAIGLRLGGLMSRQHMRATALTVLILVGLSSILTPWLA